MKLAIKKLLCAQFGGAQNLSTPAHAIFMLIYVAAPTVVVSLNAFNDMCLLDVESDAVERGQSPQYRAEAVDPARERTRPRLAALPDR